MVEDEVQAESVDDNTSCLGGSCPVLQCLFHCSCCVVELLSQSRDFMQDVYAVRHLIVLVEKEIGFREFPNSVSTNP